MHQTRHGTGRPLLLVHGLGGSGRSWDPVLPQLAAEREVIAVDLPGFGNTPPLEGPPSVSALADALESFLDENDLRGVDVAGSSMGARLVLELVRRGAVGAAVALDPGGFWNDRERRFFAITVAASIRLIRLLQPLMPQLTASAAGRALLFAQFSARPWRLDPDVTLREMRSFASSPGLDATLHELVNGPTQEGAPQGTARGPLVIGWGRGDRVCLQRQARRAAARFPDARLAWFDACGHFPQWDAPDETARLILATTAANAAAVAPA